jgi:hypothetical protein
MHVCPVCETSNIEPVCEVCGHTFALAPSPSPEIAPLPELDVAPPPGAAPVVPLIDLEPTRLPPAALPTSGTEGEADWESTREPRAPDAPAGGLPELDPGREVDAVERPAPSAGPVTCRYCRNVQATGMLCERCGMRLPWSRRTAVAAAPAGALDDTRLVRCHRCGARTYVRERCAACGSLLAVEV